MLNSKDKIIRVENINRLIKALQSKGLSVPKIASKIGLKRNTLYSWMSGSRNVKEYLGVVVELEGLLAKWERWDNNVQ